MRILADECVFRITTETLREAGHDVVTAQELSLAGQPDAIVLTAASDSGFVFLTNDMHFGNILAYPPSRYHGIIVLRIRPRSQAKVHGALLRFLRGKDQSDVDESLIIVDQNKYRIRHGR